MMIWVHGILMPERGETETRVFFLMGTDRWIDGAMDRSIGKRTEKKRARRPAKKSTFRASVVAAVRRNLCVR